MTFSHDLVSIHPSDDKPSSVEVEVSGLSADESESSYSGGVVSYTGTPQSHTSNENKPSLTLTLRLSGITQKQKLTIVSFTYLDRPIVLRGSITNTQTFRLDGGALAAAITTGCLLLSGLTFTHCRMSPLSSEPAFGGAVAAGLCGAGEKPANAQFFIKMEGVKFGPGNGNDKIRGGGILLYL